MRNRSLIAGAVALALVFSLAACGDDGDEDTTDTTTTVASDDTAADTTEAETDDTAADTTEAETETTTVDDGTAGDLTPFLVTPEAVGEGFTESDYETSTEPGPCGSEIDSEYPYDAIVGTVLVEEELQLALQHELRTYADAATAEETYNYAQEALGCGADTAIEGVTLGEVTDVTDSIGADAFAVEVTSDDGTTGALVAVLAGPVLSVWQFQGPADVEDGPDPVSIVAENTTALLAEVG